MLLILYFLLGAYIYLFIRVAACLTLPDFSTAVYQLEEFLGKSNIKI